jgi:hypothetical protein
VFKLGLLKVQQLLILCFCVLSVYVGFMILAQTANISLNSNDQMNFLMAIDCAFYDVQTEFLNITVMRRHQWPLLHMISLSFHLSTVSLSSYSYWNSLVIGPLLATTHTNFFTSPGPASHISVLD